jgi:hypothetical protein
MVRIRDQQDRRKHQWKKFVEIRTLIREMEEKLLLKRQGAIQGVMSLNGQPYLRYKLCSFWFFTFRKCEK